MQPGIFSLSVSNGFEPLDLIIFMEIRGAGGRALLSAETDPQPFAALETILYTSTSELGGQLEYDDDDGAALIRTGRLPEGDFNACVRVEDLAANIISQEQCVPFSIFLPDPPFLLSPADGESVSSEYPTFAWTPIQLPIGFDFGYTFQVAEIRTGQQPFEALTSNVLHHDEEFLSFESYSYPFEAQALEPGTTYAWWVLAVDADGVALTANQGRSEIRLFTVSDDESELFPRSNPNSLLVVSEAAASGPLADFAATDFETAAAELERLSADGSPIVLPFAVDDDISIEVPGVQVHIDRELKAIAIRGSMMLKGKSVEVMFSSFWGTRQDPRSKALAIKLPNFQGFFPGGGPLDELATSTAWFIAATGAYKIESKQIPAAVKDFYGDLDIDVKRGLNLFSYVDLSNSGWMADVADALGIDQPYVELQGYLGPTIGSAFNSNAEVKVTVGAELALSATIPLWRPEALREVVTEMEGALEISGSVEREQTTTTSNSETEVVPKLGIEVGVEAKVALPFLAAAERLADEIVFTGAMKVELQPGEREYELSLKPKDIVKLPAFENVISVHDPTLAVTFTYAKGESAGGYKPKSRAVSLSAKVDLGRYKNFGALKIARTWKLSTTPDSTSSSDDEHPPFGGVPTPFKQAELLAKQAEREAAAARKPNTSWQGKWVASVSADPTALQALSPAELLGTLFNFGGNFDRFPEGPELMSLGLRFLPDAPGSMELAGSAMMFDTPTFFVASRMRLADGSNGMLFGITPHEFSFQRSFPDIDIPLLSQVELSNVGLLFASEEFTASSDDLYGEQYGFYRTLYGSDDFTVTIKPGLNLIASLPGGGLDPESPLIPLMEKLGVQQGPALIQGAIGRQIRDAYFRASLPPMRPPGAPDWFEFGQVDLELTGQPSIGLVGSLGVNIDDDTVVFFVRTSAGVQGLILSGGIDAPGGWHGPFGVEWITLNRTALLLGLSPAGSVQIGFEGDLVVGEKDIRVAMLTAISPAGVPTNFMIDGESEAGVSVSDLVLLQAAIASAETGGEVEALATDRLPPLGVQDLKLKFAPKDSPELNIERGLAIGGMLGIKRSPDEPMELIAMADFSLDMNGVVARAAVGDFAIGPVSLTDAMIDLSITRDAQYFRLSGAADLTILQASIDVDVTPTELKFDAEGRVFGLFEADVSALGRVNLQDPRFTINGRLRNDFADVFGGELVEGAIASAERELDAASQARDEAIDAHVRARDAATAALRSWAATPVFPRGPKLAARNRWAAAANRAGSLLLRRSVAAGLYTKWSAFHGALVAARGAAQVSPVRIRAAAFDGDLARIGSSGAVRLTLDLEVRGQALSVSADGFNFRDRGPGAVQIAAQAVRQAFNQR